MLSEQQIKDHVKSLSKKFVYTKDPEGKDLWKSFFKEYQKGNVVRGDCDDWAATIIEIWLKAGHPPSKIWRGLVCMYTPKIPDHFVAYIEDSNGIVWMSDCNAPFIVKKSNMTYKARYESNLTHGIRWREVK